MEKMRIGIDARWIFAAVSGIGRYTRNLISSLAEVDPINEYIIIFDDPKNMETQMDKFVLGRHENFQCLCVPYPLYSIKNMRKLPRLLDQLQLDIYHSTNFMAPVGKSRCKILVNIHDLIPYLFPKYVPRSKKKKLMPLFKLFMRRIAKKADGIITGSENTRQDILRCFKIPPEKVKMIYDGIENRYFTENSSNEKRGPCEKFNIGGNMILCVGRADPYKNIMGLVRAFRELVAHDTGDYSLVLVGEEDSRYPEAKEFVEQQQLGDRVFFAGYLDDDALLRAYRQADLLVHPSLYEGFGFPPLEAMACGTPVVSSDRASLPEVLGKAAIFVDPEKPDQMAEAIARVLADEELKNRLTADGRSRAACFPLDKMARETLQFYRQCYFDQNSRLLSASPEGTVPKSRRQRQKAKN